MLSARVHPPISPGGGFPHGPTQLAPPWEPFPRGHTLLVPQGKAFRTVHLASSPMGAFPTRVHLGALSARVYLASSRYGPVSPDLHRKIIERSSSEKQARKRQRNNSIAFLCTLVRFLWQSRGLLCARPYYVSNLHLVLTLSFSLSHTHTSLPSTTQYIPYYAAPRTHFQSAKRCCS